MFDVFEVVVLDVVKMFDVLALLFAVTVVLCDFMLTSGLARMLWVQLVHVFVHKAYLFYKV